MTKQGKYVLAIVAISFVGAVIAKLSGRTELSEFIGAPALALSGLVALGHLVTLDDDMPGEWSNPEGAKEIWRESLIELLVKIVVVLIVAGVIYV